jgi:hypothetical protein
MHRQIGGVDDDGSGVLEYADAAVEEQIECGIIREKAPRNAKARAAQAVDINEAQVVALEAIADGDARRIGGIEARHDAEHDGGVAHASGQRPCGVLAVR